VHAILGMHTMGSSALPQTINFMTFSTLHIPLSQVQMFDNGVLQKHVYFGHSPSSWFFSKQHICHRVLKFSVSWTIYQQLDSILTPADI
jgi:hypothetical protein